MNEKTKSVCYCEGGKPGMQFPILEFRNICCSRHLCHHCIFYRNEKQTGPYRVDFHESMGAV